MLNEWPNLFNSVVFHGVYSLNCVIVLLSSLTQCFLFIIMGVMMEKITGSCCLSSVSKGFFDQSPDILMPDRQIPKTAISVGVI